MPRTEDGVAGRRVGHHPDDVVDGPIHVMCERDRDVQRIADQVHDTRGPAAPEPRRAVRNAVRLVGLAEKSAVAVKCLPRDRPGGEDLLGQELSQSRPIPCHFCVGQVRGVDPEEFVEQVAAVVPTAGERIDRRRLVVLAQIVGQHRPQPRIAGFGIRSEPDDARPGCTGAAIAGPSVGWRRRDRGYRRRTPARRAAERRRQLRRRLLPRFPVTGRPRPCTGAPRYGPSALPAGTGSWASPPAPTARSTPSS